MTTGLATFLRQDCWTDQDWAVHLVSGDRVEWTGRPDLAKMVVPVALFFGMAAMINVWFLCVTAIWVLQYLYFAGDQYALTTMQVIRRSKIPFGKERVTSLARAGTYHRRSFAKHVRGIVFTAPDHRKIMFHFLSAETYRLLMEEYPKGGPKTQFADHKSPNDPPFSRPEAL